MLDFGLVRLLGDDLNAVEELTRQGIVLGTLDYLSFEQAENNKAADIRSDIYSLGCTFYYLLTGDPPFPGLSDVQKVLSHRSSEPVPVGAIRSDMPPGLDPVIRKMMAKHRNTVSRAWRRSPMSSGPSAAARGMRDGLTSDSLQVRSREMSRDLSMVSPPRSSRTRRWDRKTSRMPPSLSGRGTAPPRWSWPSPRRPMTAPRNADAVSPSGSSCPAS